MKTGNQVTTGIRVRLTAASAALLLALPLFANAPGDAYPQYPQTTPYPQQPAPGTVMRPPRMRDMFAATLATVLQTTGQTAMMSVSQGLQGAINNWFVRNTQGRQMMAMPMPAPMPGYANNMQPQSAPGAEPAYPSYPTPNESGAVPPANDNGAYPAYPSNGDVSPAAAPANANYPSYPTPGASGDAYPNPQTESGGNVGAPPAMPASSPIYAGIAYEVHAIGRDGSTTRVDPASHVFHTGDRFRVFYRPALPGRVDVFNINGSGQNTQIDTVQVAAGDLASLGPYEFSDAGGSETLILRLSPCATPALVAATRSIVKVQGAAPTQAGLNLGSCGATSTRGIHQKTRSIRKVAVEGGTSFALDQVAPSELSSGQLDARQVTITLQHQ